MTLPVYADAIRPASIPARRLIDAALVCGFSILIAASAQIAILLPFTPIPITLQTMMVLATGALLGSRRGPAAILLYLAEGAVGLPVFSAGRSGLAFMAGPTGGYLIGFVAAAFIAGLLSERGWDRKGMKAFFGLMMADAAIYVSGVMWLGVFTGFTGLLVMGVLPFVAVDIVKAAVCAALLPLGWKALARR